MNMLDSEVYFDTNFADYNVEKIRGFGEAIIFGRNLSEQDENCGVYLNPTAGACQSPQFTLDKLVLWLSRDYENNYALLSAIATEFSKALIPDPDYLVNSQKISDYQQDKFRKDIGHFLNIIEQSALPMVSSKTIALAKEVAKMDDSESANPEEWAKQLAGDISKGRD
ncbi:MAG TPA: hypothetical protein ENJ80_12960 [Gammaproteobacteria bacterium]|nr:hypothetical protein [Gammaproteobacteria bacterium]